MMMVLQCPWPSRMVAVNPVSEAVAAIEDGAVEVPATVEVSGCS